MDIEGCYDSNVITARRRVTRLVRALSCGIISWNGSTGFSDIEGTCRGIQRTVGAIKIGFVPPEK